MKILLRIVLVVACLFYAFWKVDLSRLGLVFSEFNLGLVISAQAYMLAILALPALRINFLSRKQAGLSHSFKTVMLGLGINNILPARLGELAKGIYLRKEVGIPLSRGLNIVFWERFSDLNAVLLLALINAVFFVQESLVTLTLLGSVAGMWCLLILHKKWPERTNKLLGMIPLKSMTTFVSQFLSQVREHFQPRFLLSLSFYTVSVWIFFVSMPYLVLWGIADMDLSFGQILTVVVVSSLGMALPSSPGAIGVYEASIVAPLTHFGINKEEALAAAIVLHMIQYIPTTLGALFIMAKTGFRFEAVKHFGESAPVSIQS